MRKLALVALLFSSTSVLASESNTLTAGELLDACTRPSMHWVDFCNGFFQAAHDSATVDEQVCTPDGVSRTELVRLFEVEAKRLIHANSSIAQRDGISIATAILAGAFPCS